MGGYAIHAPAMYLVGWPETHVIKAGVSIQQRWRRFCLRGADLHGLFVVTNHLSTEHIELETAIGGHFSRSLTRAFASREESTGHVGHGGCGWMECYRAGSADDYQAALSDALALAREYLCDRTANAMPDADANRRCNGRTDERYEEVASPSDQSEGLNVRARIGIEEMGCVS